MAYRHNAYIPGLRPNPFATAASGFARVVGAILVALLGAGGFIALVAVISAIRGWVLSILWAWFVQPMGAPHVGIAHAIGLSLLLQTMLPIPSSKDENGKSTWSGIFVHASIPLFTLLIGWIVHAFM